MIVSPVASDEEEVGSHYHDPYGGPDFHQSDMAAPVLSNLLKFPSVQTFRDVVREANLLRGKDVKFKKNCSDKCIVVCREERCDYRIYARWMSQEKTFQIRSCNPTHCCTRKYRNSIVNSKWIANRFLEQFKSQPN